MTPRFALLAAITALFSTTALAQDVPDGLSLGGIGIVSGSPYLGEGADFQAFPSVIYRFDRFTIGPLGLSYRALETERSELDLFVEPRFFALTDISADELVGIDREITADVGLAYTYNILRATDIEATFRQEITGEHDGQEVDLRVSQGVRPLGFPIGVFGGVEWRSDNLSNYLYGVFEDEAIAGRPAFDTGDTFTPYLGASGFVPLSENLSLFGNLRVEFLEDDITDSPIIENDTVVSATFGVTFNF